VAFSPDDLPRAREIKLDGAVLGFTLLASIGAGVIFSLAPAVRFSRPDPNEDLKPGGGMMTLSLSHFSPGSLLVIAEIALAWHYCSARDCCSTASCGSIASILASIRETS